MILIILLIALAATFTQFISSWDDIVDTSRNGIKKLTKKGWLYIVCAIVLIVLPVMQHLYQIKEDIQKEKIAKVKQDERDLRQKEVYDSSILEIITVLGKYGYKFDSTNKKLVTLVRDSAKTRVIEPENPSFSLLINETVKPISHRKTDSIYTKFELRFASINATSSFFDIKFYPFYEETTGEIIYIKSMQSKDNNALNYNLKLIENSYYISSVDIPNILVKKNIYFWVDGTYKNIFGNKTFTVNELYRYEISSGETFVVDDFVRDTIVKKVPKKILNK